MEDLAKGVFVAFGYAAEEFFIGILAGAGHGDKVRRKRNNDKIIAGVGKRLSLRDYMNRIICLLFIGIGFASCKNAKPAVYFIPKNYEGVFAVVYDQIQGTDVPDDPLGRRAFIIPEDGILISKAPFSDGLRDDSFLQNTDSGYKTLKTYMPNKDTSGKKFDKTYYEEFSNDPIYPS
jgi:hypothetical protein